MAGSTRSSSTTPARHASAPACRRRARSGDRARQTSPRIAYDEGMHESDLLVFLLSLAVLLSAARLLGELARRMGLPLVFGELASGIFLGPTLFGRLAPDAQHWLF